MIEVVTCRCCGMRQERPQVHAGNLTGPGCDCSKFWCLVSAKCIAHCPEMLSLMHKCSSNQGGSYVRTFSYRYRADAAAAGMEKKQKSEKK